VLKRFALRVIIIEEISVELSKESKGYRYSMQDGFNRIGISGGTFDPIHNGHLIIAAKVKKQFNLDKVIFVPTGFPPHKKETKVTDAQHRYNMLCSAVSSISGFEVSKIEIEREGLTYTIDTLTDLKKIYGLKSKFFFITGSDVIHDLLTWREFEKVFTMCEFVTALRPGFLKAELIRDIDNLRKHYSAKISMIEIPQIDISSTMIRDKVKLNQSINNLVPKGVEEYIRINNLYK
jgi:nicotinate-nucleotide adenylyltransferase